MGSQRNGGQLTMSIIKGKTNVVAGFGGTKRPLGEVYPSQSSLATDNPGALPGWTGDYYENGKTLFPDLYNFVKAHSELQVTKAQYDDAIATYGECPKYVVDENSGTTEETVSAYKITWSPSSKNTDIILSQTPQVGDLLYRFTEPTIEPYPLYAAETHQIEAVGYTDAGVLNSLTISGAAKTVSSLTSVTGTIHIAVAGTSLRLPKRQTTGRYLVKKEVNGNDWYALYSDGWLEQGGYFANPQTIGTTAITETFWKPYATPPTLLFGNMSTRHQAAYDSEHYPYNVTATGFTHENVQPGGQGTRWYAFGYAAATPMENIKYPWISAYTSAIPASVAQAAEFTNALTGKANTDLSNVLANIDYVVESKVPTESDPSWYEVWKSGKVRQGGSNQTAGAQGTQYTFLKPFASGAYTFIATPILVYDFTLVITEKTATTYKVAYSSSKTGYYDWIAEGQGA